MGYLLSLAYKIIGGFSDQPICGFTKHMYKELQVYFISNLVNLDNKLHQLQENDINSLSGKDSEQYEHILKYEDLLKL
ncbi:hypothetical protein RhiirB3_458966 [Rhizophagus irregularis]|nr:hypothetical protein RhiirB3_458966 [Rhizophagus irregularis]